MNRIAAEDKIVVFVLSSSGYESGMKQVALTAAGMSKKVCYITLNKPYSVVLGKLKSGGVDVGKFVFIDSVSARASNEKNVFFVSSPRALTELSITISQVMKDIDSAILDSLSTLLIYEDPATVIKFAHSVVTKARMDGKRFMIAVLKDDLKSDVMKDLNMFVDKVVEV